MCVNYKQAHRIYEIGPCTAEAFCVQSYSFARTAVPRSNQAAELHHHLLHNAWIMPHTLRVGEEYRWKFDGVAYVKA